MEAQRHVGKIDGRLIMNQKPGAKSHQARSDLASPNPPTEGSQRWWTRTIFSIKLILVGLIHFLIARQADASGLYSVTYVGNSSVIQQDSQSITNNQTSLNYAFATTTTPFTSADSANLPQTTVLQGASYPTPQTYSMRVSAINASGTVIGSLPVYRTGSDPWANVSLGYSIRSADGQYSPYVQLITPNTQLGAYPGQLYLSQSNQILIQALDVPHGVQLLDLKTGLSTSVDQLIPAEILMGLSSGYQVQGIDDRGDILAVAPTSEFSGHFEFSEFILTPPGLSAPTVTPEPSTLMIFGVVAGALSIRLTRGQERKSGGPNLGEPHTVQLKS